jgi:hypothetical protein
MSVVRFDLETVIGDRVEVRSPSRAAPLYSHRPGCSCSPPHVLSTSPPPCFAYELAPRIEASR